MSDLVGNPEDRFSHNEAHLFSDPLATLAIAAASSAVTSIKPEVKPPAEVSFVLILSNLIHNKAMKNHMSLMPW